MPWLGIEGGVYQLDINVCLWIINFTNDDQGRINFHSQEHSEQKTQGRIMRNTYDDQSVQSIHMINNNEINTVNDNWN